MLADSQTLNSEDLNMRTPYKMKGFSGYGNSPMKDKPTAEEVKAAVNNKSNPNSPENLGGEAFQLWKGGSKKVIKKQSDLTHGSGGELLNPNGTVNKKATKQNVANL